MTKKSVGRRQRDTERRAAAGITGKGTKSFDREKTSRCWYQLKEVHTRSQRSIEKLALLIAQYRHKVVLMKIAKNGDEARFEELQASIPPLAEKMGKDFQDLWNSHADKRKLCLSYEELMQAFKIFEAYQAFDIDLFNVFQPIIGELNAIYNKALKELMEAQDATVVETLGNQPVITDVVLEEGDKPALAESLEPPVEGLGDIAESENVEQVKLAESPDPIPGNVGKPSFEASDVRIL
jgi:hypothetical protein